MGNCPYFQEVRGASARFVGGYCWGNPESLNVPSLAEICLCRGRFEQCPYFDAAARSRARASRHPAPAERPGAPGISPLPAKRSTDPL